MPFGSAVRDEEDLSAAGGERLSYGLRPFDKKSVPGGAILAPSQPPSRPELTS